MHHATCNAQADTEPLIGITEAARQVGVSHSTLSRQVKRGQVRSHDGKVRLSEVIYDRKHKLDHSIWRGRRRRFEQPITAVHAVSPGVSPSGHRVHHAPPNVDRGVDRLHHAPDDAPIGPREFWVGSAADIPLTRGLVRQLAELVGTEHQDNFCHVGEDLINTGVSILNQEIARLKAKYGEPE